jgi:hypothetical protein
MKSTVNSPPKRKHPLPGGIYIVLYLYAKKSRDDPWASNNPIGLEL